MTTHKKLDRGLLGNPQTRLERLDQGVLAGNDA
jgi:hypothetical protein